MGLKPWEATTSWTCVGIASWLPEQANCHCTCCGPKIRQTNSPAIVLCTRKGIHATLSTLAFVAYALVPYNVFFLFHCSPEETSWCILGNHRSTRTTKKQKYICMWMHGHPHCPLLKWSRNNSQGSWVGEFPDVPVSTILLLAMVVASGLHTARYAQAMVTIIRLKKKQCKLCTSHGHNHKPQTKNQWCLSCVRFICYFTSCELHVLWRKPPGASWETTSAREH